MMLVSISHWLFICTLWENVQNLFEQFLETDRKASAN